MKIVKYLLGAMLVIQAFVVAPALAQKMATVNVVQIFGTVDPAKVNDYTEYLSLIHI